LAAPSDLYKIHVIKFDKHNATLKKGHKATLISNNFCSDPKLGMVPLTVRWMFLGIVLTCGDYTSDTIEMNEKQLRDLLESSWSVPRALDSLQSIQVLSYSKIELFINRIEKKVKEEKRNENTQKPKVQKLPAIPTESAPNTNVFLSLYCQQFKNKYQVQPMIDGKSAGIAKRLAKTIPAAKLEIMVQAYFAMPDAWLHKIKHPLNQFELKLNEIKVFAESGKFTTNKQAQQQDESASNALLLQQVREGKI
jgi:hypothetical protein